MASLRSRLVRGRCWFRNRTLAYVAPPTRSKSGIIRDRAVKGHDRRCAKELTGRNFSAGRRRPYAVRGRLGRRRYRYRHMHHVDSPYRVINEMFRVARKGIMISDHNNYAFGNSLARRVRMGLKSCGLLGAATYVRQGFNKQGYSEGDGWWYPYSLFDNYAQIARRSDKVFIFPTCQPSGDMENLVFAQSHFAIAALKGPD